MYPKSLIATFKTKISNKQFVRFVVIGTINTVISYTFYLFLIFFLRYDVAYTIVYVLGIVTAYIMHSKFVFKVKLSFNKFFLYPIVYIIQYFLNIVFLYFFNL